MKIPKLILILAVLVFSALSLTAQTRDISEKEFIEIDAKGEALLKASSHRLTRKLEYFEDRLKPGRVSENYLEEFLVPNKRHTVEEKFYNKPDRTERIWDGKFLYVKVNDGEWERYDSGASVNGDFESGKLSKSYKYLGKGVEVMKEVVSAKLRLFNGI